MFDLYVCLKSFQIEVLELNLRCSFLYGVFYASEFKKLEKIFLFLYFKKQCSKVVK